MVQDVLTRHFTQMGARLKMLEKKPTQFDSQNFDIDIRRDRAGGFFRIRTSPGYNVTLEVLDVQPKDRHLLLIVKEDKDNKRKFLCGHDERNWFIAAIPTGDRVGTVKQAKAALKPLAVRRQEEVKRVKDKDRNKHRNDAFVRQGEWFFIPEPDLKIDETLTLHNEPLLRGRGRPHIAEFLYRRGGETVYVCHQKADGITLRERDQLYRENPESRKWLWRTMVRNPQAYVMGHIRHPQHATINLKVWHRVMPNMEGQSSFLD